MQEIKKKKNYITNKEKWLLKMQYYKEKELKKRQQLLKMYPCLFGSDATAPNGLQKYPNVFLQNGTFNQVVNASNRNVYASTTYNMNVPWIFTVQITQGTNNPTVIGVSNISQTIAAQPGTSFWGAGYADFYNLQMNYLGSGSGIVINQTKNNVATQVNTIISTADSSNLSGYWFTFREYTPGTLEWIITQPGGGAVTIIPNIPNVYTLTNNIWTFPNSTNRCIAIGNYNALTTFTLVQTPEYLTVV